MEFDKGDVIVKIGESEKWYIYSVEDGFYFIGCLDNQDKWAEVKLQKEVDKDFVKVDEVEEDEVDRKIMVGFNRKFGCLA